MMLNHLPKSSFLILFRMYSQISTAHGNLELLNNIKFAENIDIGDLSLPKIKRSKIEEFEIKKELDPGNGLSISTSAPYEESETLKFEIKQDISKLFDEFDMMCLHDYDQTRVEKVQNLFERYLSEQISFSVKVLQNQLKDKANELIIVKEALKKSNSANLELHKKCKSITNKLVNLKGEIEESDSDSLELPKKIQEYENDNSKLSLKTKVFPYSHDQAKSTILKNKTQKEIKQFPCATCNSSFTRRDNLKKHVLSIHENMKDKCKFCGNKYRKDKLKEHISAVHEGKKPHKCELCNASFGRIWDMKTHIQSHDKGKKVKKKYN